MPVPAITYPLDLPSSPGFQRSEFTRKNAVALTQSDFDFSQKVYDWGGRMWLANMTLAPITSATTARQWAAFLAKLKGQKGTFLLGDASRTSPTGSGLGTPLVEFYNNKLNNSTTFASWTKDGSPIVTDNAREAPDGTTTMAYFEDDDAAYTEAIVKNTTIPNDSSFWCASVYIYPSTGTYFQIPCTFTGGSAIGFSLVYNLSTETIVSHTGATYYGVQKLSGGFYRVWLSRANNASGNTNIQIQMRPTDGVATTVGACYIWGIQLTNTQYPVNYVAADGVAITDKTPAAGALTIPSDGWTANEAGVLLAGDLIQVGSGETTRLYEVVDDVDAGPGGEAEIPIWPELRETLTDNEEVVISSPKGTFRLAANPTIYPEPGDIYTLGFNAIEAL